MTEINKLCAVWDGLNCIKCADRTFLNAQLICQKIDDQCNTWDRVNGLCLTCYKGYNLVNGVCQARTVQVNQGFITINGITGIDSNNDGILDFCKIWVENICIECVARAYFDNAGVCKAVSDQCKASSNLNGKCTECYSGFTLSNGTCEVTNYTLTVISDIGCKTWD